MKFIKHQSDIPDFLSDYLKYREFVLFNPGTTVDANYYDLVSFLKYIELTYYQNTEINTIDISQFRNIDISNLTLDDMNKIDSNDIQGFIMFAIEKLKNSSCASNRKLSSIKKLFEYLDTNNLINGNPATYLEYARKDSRIPKYLNLQSSKKLLSKVIKENSKYTMRNYAMTCLFLNCSLRLSELINIDLSDLKMDERILKVLGKGRKERILYLDDACIEALNKYLEVRPQLGLDNEDNEALFISAHNRRISPREVQYIITDELKNQGNDRLHTHSLRHSSATMMYNDQKLDVLLIKDILGHSSLKATEKYIHFNPQQLKAIMQNFDIDKIYRERELNKNGKHKDTSVSK